MDFWMNIWGLVGFFVLALFYPSSLSKAIRTKDMSSYNPFALWTLAVGLLIVESSTVYFHQVWSYLIGNGFGLICAWWLLILYYHYRKGGEENA